MTALHRRSFFSLRTLFVVVTLVAVWLGWQENLVRRRTVERNRIEAAGGRFSARAAQAGSSRGYKPYYYARLSFVRELLGDRAAAEIILPSSFTDEERHSVAEMFSESLRVYQEATSPATQADRP